MDSIQTVKKDPVNYKLVYSQILEGGLTFWLKSFSDPPPVESVLVSPKGSCYTNWITELKA